MVLGIFVIVFKLKGGRAVFQLSPGEKANRSQVASGFKTPHPYGIWGEKLESHRKMAERELGVQV